MPRPEPFRAVLVAGALAACLRVPAVSAQEPSRLIEDTDRDAMRAVECALADWLDGPYADLGLAEETMAERRASLDFERDYPILARARRRAIEGYREPLRSNMREEFGDYELAELPALLATVTIDGPPLSADNLADAATAKVAISWLYSPGPAPDIASARRLREFYTWHFASLGLKPDEVQELALTKLFDVAVTVGTVNALGDDADDEALRRPLTSLAIGGLWSEGIAPPFMALAGGELVHVQDSAELAATEPPDPADPDRRMSDRSFGSEVPDVFEARRYCADGRLMMEYGRPGSPDVTVGRWRLVSADDDGRVSLVETLPDVERPVDFEPVVEDVYDVTVDAGRRVELVERPREPCPARPAPAELACPSALDEPSR